MVDEELRAGLRVFLWSVDCSGALAEADSGQALFVRAGAEGDPVAVLEEGSELAGGEAEGLRVVLLLQQASLRACAGAGDGAGGEQVAWAEIAAVAGVVGEQLGDRPVKVAQVASAEQHGRSVVLAHVGGPKIDLQREIDAVAV